MLGFGEVQALQQAIGFLMQEVVDDPADGMSFESGNAFDSFRRLDDKMQIVLKIP